MGSQFQSGISGKIPLQSWRKADTVEDLKKAQEFIQFEIDALAAESKQEKKQEPPKHPNCKCAVHPIFKELENGEGVSCGVIEMEIPVGTSPEEIIQMVIKKIYGGEE